MIFQLAESSRQHSDSRASSVGSTTFAVWTLLFTFIVLGVPALLVFASPVALAQDGAVADAIAPAHDHAHIEDTNSGSSGAIIAGVILVLLITGMILFFQSFAGENIMEFRIVKWLLKSRWYPGVIQFPTFVFFGFIVYYFFFGAAAYADNPASVLSWTLWWPLVPITFVLFGRLWCAVCPFPIIGDFVQRFVQPTRKAGRFLTRYGIWITDGLFIGITLFDRLYGMVDRPLLSGAVFLTLLLGVISLSLVYERRTFCRHVCFLGGVSGNYSMLAGMSVEPKDKAVCAKCNARACYVGSGTVAGCPFSNVLPNKEGMRNCTLCANCIKACPHDNVAVRIRGIASELWSHAKVSFSESFFAKLMVGIVIIQNLGMLPQWYSLADWFMARGFGEKAAISTMYGLAMTIPLLLMTISSYVSSRMQSTRGSTVDNFAAFGYAFIPIDVAGHIAHNLFHLLAEGWSIIGAFSLMIGGPNFAGAITSPAIVNGLQFGFLTAGGIGTLYVAYKIARAKETTLKGALRVLLPHALLLTFIIAVNFFLFTSPMGHRGELH